jgi:hypothetical protein
VLGRLGACPQMGTYQVIRPFDNGDFGEYLHPSLDDAE